MTHNLLVPCVYISNKQTKWTLTQFFLIETGWKGGVTKLSAGRKKKYVYFSSSRFYELFFILNVAFYWKWFYFLLVPSVDMIETKNSENIFIVNIILGQITSVTKMSLHCIRSVNTGLHCSCFTLPVVVQTVDRKTMISASIQHMLRLGCIIQWFLHLGLPFESSEVSQNQRSSKHNWAGVRGEHWGYYDWGWSSIPLL